MEKIAIIGGGIIGMTLANYVDTTKYGITLFDHGIGQATIAVRESFLHGYPKEEIKHGIV